MTKYLVEPAISGWSGQPPPDTTNDAATPSPGLTRRGISIQSMGTFGVYVFFALSGLTMAMVYGSSFSRSIRAADLRRFYFNRVARLMPLLALVAGIAAA